MQVLEMSGEDALFGGEEERVDAAHVLDLPGHCLVVQQIGKDPADLLQSQESGHFLHLGVLWIVQQLNRVTCALLRRLVDCDDSGADAQRNVGMDLVSTVEEPDALISAEAPKVQKLFHNPVVLEHHIIDVSIGLAVECDRRRLTL